MNNKIIAAAKNIASHRSALLVCVLAIALAGCSTTKTTPVAKPEAGNKDLHERGWIGGKVELVGEPRRLLGFPLPPDPPLPAGLAKTNHMGLLITRLASNTPCSQAGLREGDLIVDLKQKPVTTLHDFRKLVDASKPGTTLPVTVWREGQSLDYNVCVGRETFNYFGTFAIGFPFYRFSDLGWLDLWPNPDFSLGFVLGYETKSDERKELNTPKGDYYRAATGRNYSRSDTDWNAWMVIFCLSKGENIHAQEIVSATNSVPSSASQGAK